MEHINIAMAADVRYAQHATVAMVSILLHAAHPERIRFYLLADQLPADTESRVRASIERHGAAVNVIPLSPEKLAGLYTSGQLSRTAYARLQAAELLPRTVQRLLYLDCDILAHDDIEKLWEMNLDGHPVGAVKDFGIMASGKSWNEKEASLGVRDGEAYFNSGLLLLNLGQWRENEYGRKIAELVRQRQFRHHDQDALNLVFRDDWKVLPMRWNVIPPVYDMFWKVLRRSAYRREAIAAMQDIGILHYAGGYKPWEYDRHAGFNDEYYRCLEKTAFSDAPMPQFDARRKHRSLRRQLLRMAWGRFWARV